MAYKRSSDYKAANELCMLIKWLESMSKRGKAVDNIDAKALGRVARKMREMYEALDALVAHVESEARNASLAIQPEDFEADWKRLDPEGYEAWLTGKRVLELCSQHSSEEPLGGSQS